MSWFEKLKEFIRAKFDINVNVTNSNLINIQINNNNSPKQCEFDEENNFLSVNTSRLSPIDLQEFKKIVTEELFEDRVFLEKSSQERVVDIESKEKFEDVQQLLKYFGDKIPPNNYRILRQAVYIKKTFEENRNSDIIYKLKGDIIKKYGRRGLNICNLYSSGYFDMIKNMYEEMFRHGLEKETFLESYNLIIEEQAFAVFVAGNMSQNDVKNIIEKKIERNTKYGFKGVTIHGIGKNNALKIIDVISDIEKNHPIFEKKIEEKGNIIFARLIWQ
jgi:hypothetical protein